MNMIESNLISFFRFFKTKIQGTNAVTQQVIDSLKGTVVKFKEETHKIIDDLKKNRNTAKNNKN